jgi:hypothetical protein
MNYSRISNYIFSGFFFLSVLVLNSCTKEATTTITGDTVNRVFVKTPTSYINLYKFSIIHTPVSELGTVLISFPARSTMAAPSDVKVSFQVDNSLISAYNTANGTNFSQIPDSLLTLVNTQLTIPKGAYSSVDSLSMSITNKRLHYLPDPGYILPIKITSISTVPNTVISTNENIVYVVINTSSTNCYNTPLIGDMVGTLITPRTAWTATLDATLNSGALTNMFDAKTNTYWFVSPAKEVNLTVNLGSAVSNITGIRIHSYSTSYSLTSAVVYTSIDGTTWTSQGIANLSTASSYQYIKFYSPIASAKYIKLDVKSWKSGSYVIMAEFDVYKN